MIQTIKLSQTRANAASAWLERTNPLKGLSIRQAQSIYDLAKNGNYCQLHYIYHEIEAANPTLMTCVERRSSALAGLGWKASASASALDATLADEQKRAIAELAESFTNLDETIEHLALAFFRGFGHARIVRALDGTPKAFDLLNSWNFAFDAAEKLWYWNPACKLSIPGKEAGLEVVPEYELLSVVRPRAIDYPALAIHIRHALAERDWGRFLERYGIPPVFTIMPQGATEEDRDLFLESSQKLANGRGAAFPSGSDVKFAQEARGVNPFTDFITHQEKTIVLLATGGTLTSLAEAGSGTLAGNAQMDVWEQIVARDGVMIGNAIDRTIIRPYLQARFKGQPIVAHFELGKETEASPSEVLEMGAKAKAAGYRIAKATLEEKTGYTLEEDTPAAQPGFPALNAALQAKGEAIQALTPSLRAEGEAIHTNETKEEPVDTDYLEILQAFAASGRHGAQEVEAFINHPSQDEAEKVMRFLEENLHDETLEALLEQSMAKAIAKELGGAASSRAKEPIENASERTRKENGNDTITRKD